LVAEVVHGAPCRFTDPARFSLAHGGRTGTPTQYRRGCTIGQLRS
jgi:hypothetical protein